MDATEEWNSATVTAARLRRALDGMAADAAAGAPAASLYLTADSGLVDNRRGNPCGYPHSAPSADKSMPAANKPAPAPGVAGCRYAAALGVGCRCAGAGGDGCPYAAALRGGCGLAAFRVGGRGLVVAPPFPLTGARLSAGWDDAPLRRLLDADFAVGVVLVRLGRFSVALFRRGQLVASKTDARYVKGRHHAGGTSQLRYTRVREGQIRRLYGKVCEAVQCVLSPPPDYVVLGGERFTLSGLLKDCPALVAMQAITLRRRLNIRDPKRDALPQAAAMLTESRVWTMRFDADGAEIAPGQR